MKTIFWWFIRAFLVTCALGIMGASVSVGFLYQRYVHGVNLPPLSIFEEEEIFRIFPFSTRIFAHDQTEQGTFNNVQIGESYLSERRFFIPKKQLPELKLLTEALLSSEDHYYFYHPGINPVAIVSALIDHYLFGRPLRGRSTIPQQFVKNVLRRRGLINIHERSIAQKVQEIYLTVKLEQYLTLKCGGKQAAKQHVLWLYLNTIPMGRVNGGFAAAAYDYFGLPPEDLSQLTLEQALILAALPKGPEKFLPAFNVNLPASLARTLLKNRMIYAALGMKQRGVLSDKDLADLRQKPFSYVLPKPRIRDCDEFLTEVERALDEYDRFAQGTHPFLVHTTCVVSWQRQARHALKQQTSFIDANNGLLNEPQGAVVFTEMFGKLRGAVTVLVGNKEPFTVGNFNRALQARRPAGSTFKLPVYYLLLKDGLSATTSVSTARVCLPPFQKGLPSWCPKNSHPAKLGIVSAEYALAHSINTATARFVALINSRHGRRRSYVVQEMVKLLAQGGIPRQVLDFQPSLPLGPSGVTPLELTQFYAAMTHDGLYVKPYLVESCHDERTGENCNLGEIMRREEREIADPKSSGLLTHMLIAASQPGGTAARVGKALALHQVAVKTGTSQRNSNTWVVGCTKEICGTVWIGFDEESIGLGINPVTGAEWQGGRTAGPPWAKTAEVILAGRKPQQFTAPPGVVAIRLVKERMRMEDGTSAIGIRCARDQEELSGKLSYTEWYSEERRPRCEGYISKRLLLSTPLSSPLPLSTPPRRFLRNSNSSIRRILKTS